MQKKGTKEEKKSDKRIRNGRGDNESGQQRKKKKKKIKGEWNRRVEKNRKWKSGVKSDREWKKLEEKWERSGGVWKGKNKGGMMWNISGKKGMKGVEESGGETKEWIT